MTNLLTKYPRPSRHVPIVRVIRIAHWTQRRSYKSYVSFKTVFATCINNSESGTYFKANVCIRRFSQVRAYYERWALKHVTFVVLYGEAKTSTIITETYEEVSFNEYLQPLTYGVQMKRRITSQPICMYETIWVTSTNTRHKYDVWSLWEQWRRKYFFSVVHNVFGRDVEIY